IPNAASPPPAKLRHTPHAAEKASVTANGSVAGSELLIRLNVKLTVFVGFVGMKGKSPAGSTKFGISMITLGLGTCRLGVGWKARRPIGPRPAPAVTVTARRVPLRVTATCTGGRFVHSSSTIVTTALDWAPTTPFRLPLSRLTLIVSDPSRIASLRIGMV